MSKPNQLIDAVKTATDIHNGDYSSLRGKYLVIRGKIKKTRDHHPGDNTVKKPTLSQRMDQLDGRIDRIEVSITKLAEEMRNGFKQVNTRIDNLEKRIDGIDARLDYNGLKKLPKSR
ncbi:MAG: hypothetical protein MJ213_00560 [Bacilli bacterium]|nr:hypothetical protein [Bacilli bacterium]